MLKRPVNSRFNPAILEGRKITTIREKPWPVGKPVMLYNWSGLAYRSKQADVAAVIVEGTQPIWIERAGEEIIFRVEGHAVQLALPSLFHLPSLWQLEGFDSRDDMDNWFRAKMKPGQKLERALMRFRLHTTPHA